MIAKNEVKISVIVPVYNVGKFVERCLESIIDNSFKDIEIICVNDCSTDDSLEKINAIKKTDSRIIVIENDKNLGLAATRNRGMKVATGKYLFFVDSDDWIHKDCLQILYDEAEKKKLDLLYYDMEQLFEEQETGVDFIFMESRHSGTYPDVYVGTRLLSIVLQRGCSLCAAVLCLYNKQFIFENNLWFCERVRDHEDTLFYIETITKAKRTGCIPIPLYYYYRRSNSISTDISKAGLRESFESCLYVCDRVVDIFNKVDDEVSISRKIFLSWAFEYLLSSYDRLDDNDKNRVLFDRLKLSVVDTSFLTQFVNYIFFQYYKPKYTIPIEIIKHNSDKELIIYGAGKVAKCIIDYLHENGIDNFKIAITNKPDSQMKFLGNEVYELSEITNNDNSLIIIASTDYFEEMQRNAYNMGFSNVVIVEEKKMV